MLERKRDSRTEWEGPMGPLGIRDWLSVTVWGEVEDELVSNLDFTFIYFVKGMIS